MLNTVENDAISRMHTIRRPDSRPEIKDVGHFSPLGGCNVYPLQPSAILAPSTIPGRASPHGYHQGKRPGLISTGGGNGGAVGLTGLRLSPRRYKRG